MILFRGSRVEKLPVPKEGLLSHSPHMDRIGESRGEAGRWEEEQIQVSLSNSYVIPRGFFIPQVLLVLLIPSQATSCYFRKG